MHIVVLTGAGVSAESGLKTFRDSGGLWEGHRVEDVATPDAWRRDPELVLKFYNERRRAMYSSSPNAAHKAIADLEKIHHVTVITQNVDDLHERAGSSSVLHLHGELDYARSSHDPSLIIKLGGKDIKIGDHCEKGNQLRPHIVWFGEDVPLIEEAAKISALADLFLIVGTSLVVYPAAGLIHYVRNGTPITVIDPGSPEILSDIRPGIKATHIQEKASTAVPRFVEDLLG